MNITSGKSLRTAAISRSGFRIPHDVSLWMRVSESNSPVESFSRTISGRIADPHGTCSASACLPQRWLTSNHLSENAPHIAFRTFVFVRLRIEPSMTPHAEEVERKTGRFVPNSSWSRGWIPA